MITLDSDFLLVGTHYQRIDRFNKIQIRIIQPQSLTHYYWSILYVILI